MRPLPTTLVSFGAGAMFTFAFGEGGVGPGKGGSMSTPTTCKGPGIGTRGSSDSFFEG